MAGTNAKAALVLAAAILLSIAVVWLATASAYWSGTIPGRWHWTAPGLIFSLLIGTLGITLSYPFESAFPRLAGMFLLFLCLCLVLVSTAVATSCFFGNCF